jgi:cbb3-type cytochrome oxidase subunit 1
VIPNIIGIIIAVVIFAVVALGLLWICSKFLDEFPIARWICGALLIIVILLYISGQIHLPSYPHTQ